MMTARPPTNSRPVVRFNEVVQFDDKDCGCLSVEKIQVRMPLSSMEQSRWLPTLDSPPESPKKNKGHEVMSLETKRKIMKELGLSCPSMPPQLPIRRSSSRNSDVNIAKKSVSTTTHHQQNMVSSILSTE